MPGQPNDINIGVRCTYSTNVREKLENAGIDTSRVSYIPDDKHAFSSAERKYGNRIQRGENVGYPSVSELNRMYPGQSRVEQETSYGTRMADYVDERTAQEESAKLRREELNGIQENNASKREEAAILRTAQQSRLRDYRAQRAMQGTLLGLNMSVLGVNMSMLGLNWTLKQIPGVSKDAAKQVAGVMAAFQFALSMVNMVMSIVGIGMLFKSISLFGLAGGWGRGGSYALGGGDMSGMGGMGMSTGTTNISVTSSSPTYVERQISRSLRLSKG